jgi:VIT1/CCC1 family predicted Fe2+/Mn2+ transporter
MLNDGRSIPELFTDLVAQLSMLVRKEIQLAKAEASEKLTKLLSGLGMMIGGAVLMIAALGVLLEAAALWIVIAGLAPQWAYLIVGVVTVLIGAVLVKIGLDAMSVDLTPRKTVEQLQRDAAVAKEQIQ